MTRWSAGSVQTNGINMHYFRSGGDKPPLLLAHGLTDSGLCWRPVVPILATIYDCIMPDARGHGFSDAPPAGYTNADHAADYAGLIEALDLDRPALLGHSMGAGTAAQLGATYPTLVRGLLLEDPPWRGEGATPTPAEHAQRVQEWRTNVKTSNAATLGTLLQRGREQQPTWSAAELDSWAIAKQLVSPTAIDYAAHRSRPWQEIVPQLQCPTLLITGDAELGAIVDQATAQTIAAANSNVRVSHIAGAGHSIRREQTEHFLATVQEFLAMLYR